MVKDCGRYDASKLHSQSVFFVTNFPLEKHQKTVGGPAVRD